VIALPNDADVLNPLFWSNSSTGLVLQFTFPDLAEPDFDTANGAVTYAPMLAKSWEWSDQGRTLAYHLRSGAKWEDESPVTSQDVKFAYFLYANPKIASTRKTALTYFLKNDSGQTDIERSIDTPDDSTLIFHFQKAFDPNQQLQNTQLYFLPKHIYEQIEIGKVRTSNYNDAPITGKHFTVKKWSKKQEIVLDRNPHWTIPHAAYLDRVVFRIIPEMTTRVVELKSGNVDFVEGLSPDDVQDLSKNAPQIRFEKQSYRRFDYLGWSNIDGDLYRKSEHKKIQPHALFGDSKIRRALTMAIDRNQIIQAWLGEYGQAAIGPVSPLFKWAYNDTLKSMPYNPAEATRTLNECGWRDHDGDGILDKDGKKFEFTITTNSANPRRSFAVQAIQSDLKKIGIACHTQLVESNVFNVGLKNKEYEAFIGGLNVSAAIDLKSQFHSDLEKNTFNFYSYQNLRVDSLLDMASTKWDPAEAGTIFKEIQSLIDLDQPVTFLYWFDNIVGINNRLQGTHVDFVSPYHRFYDWYISTTPVK